jgi:hypothetical protein
MEPQRLSRNGHENIHATLRLQLPAVMAPGNFSATRRTWAGKHPSIVELSRAPLAPHDAGSRS